MKWRERSEGFELLLSKSSEVREVGGGAIDRCAWWVNAHIRTGPRVFFLAFVEFDSVGSLFHFGVLVGTKCQNCILVSFSFF